LHVPGFFNRQIMDILNGKGEAASLAE